MRIGIAAHGIAHVAASLFGGEHTVPQIHAARQNGPRPVPDGVKTGAEILVCEHATPMTRDVFVVSRGAAHQAPLSDRPIKFVNRRRNDEKLLLPFKKCGQFIGGDVECGNEEPSAGAASACLLLLLHVHMLHTETRQLLGLQPPDPALHEYAGRMAHDTPKTAQACQAEAC